MKLSNETLEILKNFSSINQSILFLEGSLQKTMTPLKVVYAEAKIKEEIPQDFAIHDLNMFLGLLSLFKDPEIELEATKLIVQEGRQRATYRFCDPSVIAHPPKGKNVALGEVRHNLELSSDDLKALLKAVSLYGHEFISIEADGEVLSIRTLNVKEKESDGVSFKIKDTDQTFKYVVKVENLKILPHSYDISITEKDKLVFRSRNYDLMYVIPCEANYIQK